MSRSKNLGKAPTRFRSGIAKGLVEGSRIDPRGGRFGAGLISGFAVVTRGEALGHGLWVDETFVASVNEALEKLSDKGVKSRFTHPDLSGDGLAKGLGRVVSSKGSDGISRGELHFWRSSRSTPEGDLAGYVMERATEDAESFGSSIVFDSDDRAEAAHFVENGGRIVETFYGQEWDFTDFKSPDPDNVDNLPHARLKKLWAVDIVDDPAANPSGLFHRDQTFREAEGLLDYALGFSDRKPELVSFGVDPDRVGGFVRRFLNSRGLQVMKLKGLNDGSSGSVPDQTTKPEDATTPDQTTKPEEKKPESTETPVEGSPQLLDSRAEAKRFVEAFGAEKGGVWFAEGLSFEDASARFLKGLREENQKLREDNAKLSKQVAELGKTERDPLSSGGADENKPGNKSRSGFGSKLRLAGASLN